MSTILYRPNGNTQFLTANTTSQTLTLPACGAVMVHTFGSLLANNPVFVAISSNANVTATIANVTTSSQTVPIEPSTPNFISTGQLYNNTPGPVYVAVISNTTGNVCVTPVEVL